MTRIIVHRVFEFEDDTSMEDCFTAVSEIMGQDGDFPSDDQCTVLKNVPELGPDATTTLTIKNA